MTGETLNLMQIVAQTTTPTGTPPPAPAPDGPPAILNFVPIILLVIVFYFFMFRTKKGEKNKREEMLKQLKKGDEVQTIGGEYGRVMDTKDDRVLLKVSGEALVDNLLRLPSCDHFALRFAGQRFRHARLAVDPRELLCLK